MIARSDLRKEAYRYILQIITNLPATVYEKNLRDYIPLEELRLIKEGAADPSTDLVALLKSMVSGIVSEAAIDSHLVTPFEKYTHE